MRASETAGRIERALEVNDGLLFLEANMVYRNTYSGRGLLADNRSFSSGAVDSRGYLPVERWVASACAAGNPVPVPGEGLSGLVLEGGEKLTLREAMESCGESLLGVRPSSWPLIKVLDIGGEPMATDFHDGVEVPPIPPHVHPGAIVDGRPAPPGKLEAYFFPPTDMAPYNCSPDSVGTRLGLKEGVTREEVRDAIARFGETDRLYSLLKPYPVRPREGWIIPAGIIHAPGPWLTIEIQTPQDDYNLLAWRLGERLSGEELSGRLEDSAMRGLPDADALLGAIDWERSTDPDFRERYFRPPETVEDSGWGKRSRVFFDAFDAELVEIEPGAQYRRPAADRPAAVLVWSGSGTAGSREISCDPSARSEFIVPPGQPLDLANPSASPLLLFFFYPMSGG